MARSIRPRVLGLVLATAATVFGVSAPEVGAQASPPLTVGERVRVTTSTGGLYVGTVEGLTPTTIDLRDETGTQQFNGPRSEITRLEVSREKRSYASVGMVGGLGGGILTGFALCSVTDVCTIFGHNDIQSDVILTSAVVGMLAGVLVGHAIKRDRWEELGLDAASVAVIPLGRGTVGLGLTISR